MEALAPNEEGQNNLVVIGRERTGVLASPLPSVCERVAKARGVGWGVGKVFG